MVLIQEFSARDDDDELREFCNQACEAFVQRCPEAIQPHIPMVTPFATFSKLHFSSMKEIYHIFLVVDCDSLPQLHNL